MHALWGQLRNQLWFAGSNKQKPTAKGKLLTLNFLWFVSSPLFHLLQIFRKIFSFLNGGSIILRVCHRRGGLTETVLYLSLHFVGILHFHKYGIHKEESVENFELIQMKYAGTQYAVFLTINYLIYEELRCRFIYMQTTYKCVMERIFVARRSAAVWSFRIVKIYDSTSLHTIMVGLLLLMVSCFFFVAWIL